MVNCSLSRNFFLLWYSICNVTPCFRNYCNRCVRRPQNCYKLNCRRLSSFSNRLPVSSYQVFKQGVARFYWLNSLVTVAIASCVPSESFIKSQTNNKVKYFLLLIFAGNFVKTKP